MNTPFLPTSNLSQARQNFLQFLQYRQAFVDERHPHLWENLYQGYKAANLGRLKADFAQKSDLFGGVYEVLSSQPNLLTDLNFKKLELSTVLPDDSVPYYLETLRRAIKLQADYQIEWSTREYDYSITVKHQEGFYKGWLHECWPATSNGNVWLVINPTTAIFYQRA